MKIGISNKNNKPILHQKNGYISGVKMKNHQRNGAKNTWKKLGIEGGKIELRKEFFCQQGCSSKVLVICLIIEESKFKDINLMELKL